MRLWLDAARRAGASVLPLVESTVFARRDARPSWVHLQWPDRVLHTPATGRAAVRAAHLVLLVMAARARGARVLVTAHNAWSHDARHPALERLLFRSLGVLTTDLHLMSEAGEAEFLEHHPWFRRAARHYIPHGNYAPVVAGAPARGQARGELGFDPDARIFLTFGAVKGYKGVEDLVEAFGGLADERARLVVAGRVLDDRLGRELERAADADARITLVGRFLGDDELAALIRAADHVVLPYRRVLNSGSALLALTLGRPVVLPRTPTFEALSARLDGRWVSLFDGRLSAEHLSELPVPTDPAPDLSWCDWDRVSERLRALWAPEAAGYHLAP
jgi:beta-1,4-mannosyltransferase